MHHMVAGFICQSRIPKLFLEAQIPSPTCIIRMGLPLKMIVRGALCNKSSSCSSIRHQWYSTFLSRSLIYVHFDVLTSLPQRHANSERAVQYEAGMFHKQNSGHSR